jgi:glutaminase
MVHEEVEAALDLYFKQCSILVTCRDLAMMAARLSNMGCHPVTGKTALGMRP